MNRLNWLLSGIGFIIMLLAYNDIIPYEMRLIGFLPIFVFGVLGVFKFLFGDAQIGISDDKPSDRSAQRQVGKMRRGIKRHKRFRR